MKQWLKDAVFYEIYPQSFYDTNGDGIGDFPGIIAKLDYIKDLGCNALWINPCYDSPFKDAGYDVRDYKKIAPRYGTNADAAALFGSAAGNVVDVYACYLRKKLAAVIPGEVICARRGAGYALADGVTLDVL